MYRMMFFWSTSTATSDVHVVSEQHLVMVSGAGPHLATSRCIPSYITAETEKQKSVLEGN